MKSRNHQHALGRKKLNKEKRKKDDDVLYSQNVCGIFRRGKNGYGCSYIKLEHIVDLMIENDIKTYLIQEYHDEGNGKAEIKGYTIFWHNSKVRGKKRGVAIILSPNYAKAWKSAGGLEPITTAKGEFEGRFTGLLLQFSCINNTDTGKIVKGKHLRILLASAYHPWSEDDDSCMTC